MTIFFLLELTGPGDGTGPSFISETYSKGQKGVREKDRDRKSAEDSIYLACSKKHRTEKTLAPGRKRGTSVNGDKTSVR